MQSRYLTETSACSLSRSERIYGAWTAHSVLWTGCRLEDRRTTRLPARERGLTLFLGLQTGSGSDGSSYSACNWSLSREAGYALPSSAKVKHAWSCAYIPQYARGEHYNYCTLCTLMIFIHKWTWTGMSVSVITWICSGRWGFGVRVLTAAGTFLLFTVPRKHLVPNRSLTQWVTWLSTGIKTVRLRGSQINSIHCVQILAFLCVS